MEDEKLRQLVENYQPNSKVLKAMASIQILATVAPTASGKTTVMKALIRNHAGFEFVLDETSRRPRAGERQGVDYLFRKLAEIIDDAEKGELVQIAVGPSDLYCTRVVSYPLGEVGVIALVPAAVKQFRKLPVKFFRAAFIVPASFKQWQLWFSKQAEDSRWTNEQLERRLREARESYRFALSDPDIHFVLNDDPAYAANRLFQAAQGKAIDDETRAKDAAKANYHRLLLAN